MHLTHVLRKQHIGRMLNTLWKSRRNKKIVETGAVKLLESLRIPVVDSKEVLEEKQKLEKVDIQHLDIPTPALDTNHPLYKRRHCYMYSNGSLLLEGLDQAKVITNTVQIEDGLPSALGEQRDRIINQDQLVQNCILNSHIFDAEQNKLAKLFDPNRPAYNFPRVYGITDKRRNDLMCEGLIHLCNKTIYCASPNLVMRNGFCNITIEKDEHLLQCSVNVDMFLLSPNNLKPLVSPALVNETKTYSLPDITPVTGLKKSNFYNTVDVPICPTLDKYRVNNIHTIFLHYNKAEICNVHGTPVKENQILGRALMHSFVVATSEARKKFGENTKDLPSPIVVQCIQTDGRIFDFVLFQLNTLNLSGTDNIKNILWLKPRTELFKSASYQEGRPNLEGYNAEVFRTLMAMFCN